MTDHNQQGLGEDEIHADEVAYERATWEAIEQCKTLSPPYHPSIWINMVRQRGAAAPARHLLGTETFKVVSAA